MPTADDDNGCGCVLLPFILCALACAIAATICFCKWVVSL